VETLSIGSLRRLNTTSQIASSKLNRKRYLVALPIHEVRVGLWVGQTQSRNARAHQEWTSSTQPCEADPCPLPAAVNIGSRCAFKELHDKPGISSVTDRCSARTLVNSDGCGVFVTHRGRTVSGCRGPIRTEYTITKHTVPKRIASSGRLTPLFATDGG